MATLMALTIVLTLFGYFILVSPGAVLVDLYLSDVLGIVDGIYRTSRGQIPSVDFRSFYGVAAWYPGALGLHLGFDAARALALGHLLTAVLLLVMASLVCCRRFPVLPSAIMIVFLFFLVITPMLLGGWYKEITYGIFYTRHGWAAVAIALLFYVEPRRIRRSGMVVDSIVLACLMLYAFYLKITFGAVVLAFVAINALTSRYKRQISLSASAIFILTIVAVEIASGYNTAYLSSIFSVIETTPAIVRGTGGLFWVVSKHVGVFLLCLSALAAVYVSGRRNVFDLVFVLGCILASIMIIDQSGGTSKGLPGLASVFLVLGELSRRQADRPASCGREPLGGSGVAAIAIFGMLFAFVADPTIMRARSLLYNKAQVAAIQDAGETGVMGIFVQPASSSVLGRAHEAFGHDSAGHDRFENIRPRILTQGDYLRIIAEGVELLRDSVSGDATVLSLEQTNLFPSALGLRPTAYGKPFDFANLHLAARRDTRGSTPDHKAAERYFFDAQYVMVPVVPFARDHLKILIDKYGEYLDEHFVEYRRSPHWRLYTRR
jgi:hypothetical protein